MAAGAEIRPFVTDDRGAVAALWRACGLAGPMTDCNHHIDAACAGADVALLVAADGAAVFGSIMVGHLGHRGWAHYLAVAAERRGQGWGRRLMAAAEGWLRGRGIAQIQLMIRADNLGVRDFYARQGWAELTHVVMQRQLD
jgi:GNAT superfamily N-acetyltransferase